MLLTSSGSIRSFSHLKEVIDYAYLDDALFILLKDRSKREELKAALVKRYFERPYYIIPEQLSLVAEIETQMLNEAPATYKRQAETFDEEEIFLRGGVFKKLVPQIYNYTCCISGMRIISSKEVQMIDACHIVPFSESHDDMISNGLSLCPKVLVSSSFSENSIDYSIRQFEGKEIITWS